MTAWQKYPLEIRVDSLYIIEIPLPQVNTDETILFFINCRSDKFEGIVFICCEFCFVLFLIDLN